MASDTEGVRGIYLLKMNVIPRLQNWFEEINDELPFGIRQKSFDVLEDESHWAITGNQARENGY